MGIFNSDSHVSRIALAAIAVLLAWSCEQALPDPEDRLIAFRAGVVDEADTKVPTVDGIDAVTSLDAFYVTASIGLDMKEQQVFGKEPFALDTKSGKYVSTRYWPKVDEGYHFYASNVPIEFAFRGDFFVDTGPDANLDVVCAYIPFSDYMAVNYLDFRHILSRVGQVTLKPAQVGNGNTDYYTISDVKIYFIPDTHGHYILGDNLWEQTTTDGVRKNLATSVDALPDAPPYFTQDNDIWAIPGKYIAYLNYKVVYKEWFKTYVDSHVKIHLQQGSINDITFVLGGDPIDIAFTITVRDWNDVERNIDFMEP